MSRADEDGVLGRWSRRKLAARAPGPAADPPAPAEADPQPDDAALPEAELLAKLGLPDPDTLSEGDDFAAFLKAGVPDALRRRALRRLWLSNPALANIDGLVDYGEDFTDAAMVPEVLATAYKVGKGLLRDLAETPDAAPETDGINQESPAVANALDASEEVEADDRGDNIAIASQPAETEEEIQLRPRRMAFRYDAAGGN